MIDADVPARDRIRSDLDTTMVVVAGAGTGKTTQLVRRVVELVRSGSRLREIAAITFTEAAAAELRERIRRALAEAVEEEPGDGAFATALEDVDEAAISTLHAFAQRILLEHCAAAGLPSGFEVLDHTSDAVAFEARWARFADTLFSDAGAEPALIRGFATGLRHTDLRNVAWSLHENWDRLEDDASAVAAADRLPLWPLVDPAPVIEALGTAMELGCCCVAETDLLLGHLRLVVADAHRQLLAAGDEETVLNLLANLPPMRCAYGRQENWDGRVDEVREACATAEERRGQILSSVRKAVLDDLVPRIVSFVLRSADERRNEGRITFHDLLVLARRLLRAGGEPVEELRRRYRWILVDEFQDTDPIQVELAARLAASSEGGSDLSASRPGGLFVVGDPKQSIYRFRRADIEMFERVGNEIGERIELRTNFRSVPGILDLVNTVFGELFGSEPLPGQARHHPLEVGRVGPDRGSRTGPDLRSGAPRPQEPSSERHAPPSGPPLQLSFNSLDPLDPLDPLDSVGLSRAVGPSDSFDSLVSVNHSDETAAKRREDPVPVVVLGDRMDAGVADVRRQAAADGARYIRAMVEEALEVTDQAGQTRRARFGDIAVLIPTRTSLGALEDAFDEADVPYRLEGSSMIWESEDVRDVLAVLRAADDPSDEISVLAALRSPGLACGDDDLVVWQTGGGRWDPRSPVPPALEDQPVARAFSVLASLHEERCWHEPSSLVARAMRELRSFELAFGHRRPRDHWQRLRWLRDQARLFDETVGGSLRAFLGWAQLQADGNSATTGVGPPDPDDDAVRVMTVHGSKGLEFPVVVLAGLERQDSDGRQPQAVLWNEDGTFEVRAGGLFRTEGYEDAGLRDEELDNLERIRLLYVAMTRPKDHLVLCLHHRSRNGRGDTSLASRLLEICEVHPDLWRRPSDAAATAPRGRRPVPAPFEPISLPTGDSPPTGATEPGTTEEDWDDFCEAWSRTRATLLESARRRPVATATAIAEMAVVQAAEEPRHFARRDPGWPDAGSEPWQSSDKSLQVGRAVHAVLASVDLATGRDQTGRGSKELAEARTLAQGIGDASSDVASMVEAALGSETVRRAATRRHWRELYVAAPMETQEAVAISTPTATGRATAGAFADGRPVLEGFVDLLYEDDEGLVVVDYKTDSYKGPEDLASCVARYEPQLAAYAEALESSCGTDVARCVLLFVGSGTAVERVVEGEELRAARANAIRAARALVAPGQPRATPGS